ncbi:nucleoside transporter [Coniochaeta sp. 2T2.1]|nr:nucleoside transporter [Coniochaeta sp. 2T2.1]
MDRLKAMFTPLKADEGEYEPLSPDNASIEGSTYTVSDNGLEDGEEVPFSWLEYGIFVLLGVAMLWSWNMFLAAAPYFQKRFASDAWVLENFQSAITSTFTFTTLAAMLVLTNIQSTASYPFRISTGLLANTCVFATIAVSTKYFLWISPGFYLAIMLVLVSISAWSTGLIQNGALAYAGSFGRPEYTQAIMAGQGVAGVLPAMAQIVSVLSVSAPKPEPTSDPDEPAVVSNAAGIYFLAAVVVSLLALASFFPLVARHNTLVEHRMAAQLAESFNSIEEAERAARRYVSIPRLFRKLPFTSGAVFMCMLVAMFFPVFTSKILSVHEGQDPDKRIFTPGVFIPLGFFFWNLGDLLGRMAAALPLWGLRDRPRALFAFGMARTLFLPLYLLCNVRGRGTVVDSDLFYLLVVQFPFGLTNGWLCSAAMMTAGDWVNDSEKEAAGGFMGLSLVSGLTVGSLLSFTAAGI